MTDRDTRIKQEQTITPQVKRRGLIAGAAALVAGFAATRATQPVAAVDGDPITIAQVTVSSNPAASSTDIVMHINNPTATFPFGGTYTSNDLTADAFRGVWRGSVAPASGPQPVAVRGNGGFVGGVLGDSIASYGVQGNTTSTDGNIAGVYGTAGAGSNGVFGVCIGNNASYGVFGVTDLGRGVDGVAIGANGIGVFGEATGTGGVGVRGTSMSSTGIYGTSDGGYGMLGISTKAGFAGIAGITSTTNVAAVAGGSTTTDAEAARFNGNVTIDCTGPAASSGFVVMPMSAKHGTVTHTDGSMRLMCSIEAPESWAEDVGEAKLIGGKASVKLDADFAAVIDASTMLVYLTPGGDCKGLYFTNKTASSFEVRELQSGTSNLTFSWKVMAHPKGQKVERLAKFTPHMVTLPKTAADVATLAPPAAPTKKIGNTPKPHADTNPQG